GGRGFESRPLRHSSLSLPTAQNLWADSEFIVDASALDQGNGGQVVFWSDGNTQFFGEVLSRGGAIAGDGGFVEVSGRSQLGFDGRVDLSAPAGQLGRLLLDPERIVIVAERAEATSDGLLSTTGVTINEADAAGTILTISKAALDAVEGAISLIATAEIQVEDDVSLDFSSGTADSTGAFPSISFEVTAGPFTADPDENISTNGRSLSIAADSITVGEIVTLNVDTGSAGDVDLTARSGGISAELIDASASRSTAFQGGQITIQAAGDVTVAESILTEGGAGGSIEVMSGGAVRIGDPPESAVGLDTNVSTSGDTSSGDIVIIHGGGSSDPAVPFTVGDASENGTEGIIQAGSTAIVPTEIIATEVTLTPAEGSTNAGSIRISNTGTTEVDTGTTEVDAGTTEVDAGTTEVDTGTTDVDTGTTEVDTGTTEVDTG
ncbi:MAG: hypothetical protein AAGF75_12340, partial [Cyanobacteria bacterium P01_H01_bin.130]